MVGSAALQADLHDHALPDDFRAQVPELADLLGQVLAGELTTSQAQDRLNALEGRSLKHNGAVLDFGEAKIDSVTVGDVAAGSIDKRVFINLQVGGRTFRVGERTPLHEIERRLAVILKKVEQEGLEEAAQVLQLDLANSPIDPRWAVARRMLATDLPRLAEAVRVISAYVCNDARELIALAAPFCWVNGDACAVIPKVLQRAPRERGVAVNSFDVRTGKMYVLRGCPRFPIVGVEEVGGGWSDMPIDDLLAEVESAVRQALGAENEPLEELVADMEAGSESVFVVLPPPVPDPAMLTAIRDRFPPVTFVLLTGDVRHREFAEFKLPYVDYLMPELDTDLEQEALRHFKKAWREMKKICTT